jgi:hypothetical protein
VGKRQPVQEETLHLCSLLAQELIAWPGVTARPMFGLRAYYRGNIIFALFPDKRAPLEHPDAIMYKLRDRRQKKEGEKWRTFQLKRGNAGEAIVTLERAYSKAK